MTTRPPYLHAANPEPESAGGGGRRLRNLPLLLGGAAVVRVLPRADLKRLRMHNFISKLATCTDYLLLLM